MSKVRYNYSKHNNNNIAYILQKKLTVETGSSVEAETSYPPARLSIIKQLMYRLDSEEAIPLSTSDGNAVSNISELELEQSSTRYK